MCILSLLCRPFFLAIFSFIMSHFPCFFFLLQHPPFLHACHFPISVSHTFLLPLFSYFVFSNYENRNAVDMNIFADVSKIQVASSFRVEVNKVPYCTHLTLKMEAAYTSETSATLPPATRFKDMIFTFHFNIVRILTHILRWHRWVGHTARTRYAVCYETSANGRV